MSGCRITLKQVHAGYCQAAERVECSRLQASSLTPDTCHGDVCTAGLFPHTLQELLLAVDQHHQEQEQSAQGNDSLPPQQQQDEGDSLQREQRIPHHIHKHISSTQDRQLKQTSLQSLPSGSNDDARLATLTAGHVTRINAAVSQLLSSCISGSCRFQQPGSSPGDKHLAQALLSPHGAVWERSLALGPEREVSGSCCTFGMCLRLPTTANTCVHI